MRIYCLTFAIICVCVSYIRSDVDFDTIANQFVYGIHAKASGYRNLNNKGLAKGCCGNVIKRICQPCRWMLVLVQRDENWSKDNTKYTTIAIFSKESTELYERYEKYLLTDKIKYKFVNALMYNINLNKTIQEQYYPISTSNLNKYKYNGGYGINNILELWAEIEIKPTTLAARYYMSMLRVDSLYFKEYRTEYQKCCTGVPADVCDDECEYSISWMASYHRLSLQEYFSPNIYSRVQNISFTLTSLDLDFAFKDNLTYTISIYASIQDDLMDMIKITNIRDLPNVEYSLINQKGVYGNIIFNVSWMHTCQIYGGINCKNDCSADFGTEYCDIFSDKSKCLNGATDQNTCINLPTQCKEDTCSQRGICMLIQGIATCNCDPGYTGKFCQDYQCDSQCNGNGDCVGPNICNCYPPNTGKDCEEYPCDENTSKKCGAYGWCKILDGIAHCDCFNKFIKGENCSEAICDQDCVFGKCVYNKRLDMTNCVCNELYQGTTCNVTIKNFDKMSARPKLSAPIAIIVIALIALIVISVLIYMNLIKINLKQFNVVKDSTEQLQSVAE